MNKSKTEIAKKVELIKSIDFTQLKEKLMDPNEGKGWSKDECNDLELLYKDFLVLMLKYPEKSIVPTTMIDEFWHAHILDTRKYHEDCKLIYGEYLHHFPYFGLRGESDKKDLEDSFTATKKLWVSEFGYEVDNPFIKVSIYTHKKVTNASSCRNCVSTCAGSCTR